eukprot:362817-Chlamydomonas_euryale.AAC.3
MGRDGMGWDGEGSSVQGLFWTRTRFFAPPPFRRHPRLPRTEPHTSTHNPRAPFTLTGTPSQRRNVLPRARVGGAVQSRPPPACCMHTRRHESVMSESLHTCGN